MPELPEVETVRRGLERTVVGRTITGCVVANPKVLQQQSPGTLRERVVGSHIERVDRRGKYLFVRLSSTNCSPEPLSICIHLKMRGQLAVEPIESVPTKYFCVSFDLDGESGPRTCLRYYDAWTWGEVRALFESEIQTFLPSLAEMGPEPLVEEWTVSVLLSSLQGRRTAIKSVLLDQSVVAGVGNIYADESLYKAKIHPERPAGSLSDAECSRLVSAIKSVLSDAVADGGTTSDNFFDVAGDAGSYVPEVYGRGKKPCNNCGTTLTGIRLGGRSSVFCEVCQPRDL